MRGEGDKIDNTRRRVLKGLLELQKVKKIACVLIWTTDFGTSFFGTEKFKAKRRNPSTAPVYALVATVVQIVGSMNLKMIRRR